MNEPPPLPGAHGAQSWLPLAIGGGSAVIGASIWVALFQGRTSWLADVALANGLLSSALIGIAIAAHQAVRRSERQFRAIFDYAGIGVLDIDVAARIIVANGRAEQILGYAAGGLHGVTIHDLTAPRHQATNDALNAELRSGGRDRIESEHEYVRRDGSHVWVHVTTTAVRDGAGRPVRFIATLLDIADRKRSETQVRVSLEEKEVLLREVHHRVKNNLAVISSLFYLQSNECEDPRAVGVLQDTQDRVRSMALVHESLYRSDDMSAVAFAPYIRTLSEHLVRSNQRTDTSVELTVEVPSISMPIDQAIPCGLIMNELVTNALKHAFPAGGPARITVSAGCTADGRCEFIVRDDGIGVSTAATDQNTLGLRLVRSLGRQLEADVTIEPVERGTEARVAFTIAPPSRARADRG